MPKSVNVAVDGVSLPKEPMICSQAFDIALEPGRSADRFFDGGLDEGRDLRL